MPSARKAYILGTGFDGVPNIVGFTMSWPFAMRWAKTKGGQYMPIEEVRQSRVRRTAQCRATLAILALTLALGGLLAVGPGCTNTIPNVTVSHGAAYDGNDRNSGFIGWDQAGNGILTASAVERYNLLMVRYGTKFVPPVRPSEGVSFAGTNIVMYVSGKPDGLSGTNLWRIDKQHLVSFATAARWARQEGKPR